MALNDISKAPSKYSPEWQMVLSANNELKISTGHSWGDLVSRRQDLKSTYVRNGAVYAVKTSTLEKAGNIFGASQEAMLLNNKWY